MITVIVDDSKEFEMLDDIINIGILNLSEYSKEKIQKSFDITYCIKDNDSESRRSSKSSECITYNIN